MASLPITHVTLYKHGVGFFERRATVSGETVALSFRVEEMNDILKSLTAIDWGAGQVLGVEYATPQTRVERLAGCSIRLSDERSLQDLLVSLRGRRVRLLLDQQEALTGALLGLDNAPEEEPLATALVSLLLDDSAWVQAAPLGRVQGVEILDERGAGDLRFFLQTALTQEEYRTVTVRLSPGEHDLSVSYIAPAPTWRVSYRMVVEEDGGNGGRGGQEAGDGRRRVLLMGWGIFDNRLEEDLEGVSLALVAGMPISFVYDLYTPFTPARPEVKEEGRVAAAPVLFEQAAPALARMPAAASFGAADDTRSLELAKAAAPARRRISAEALEVATPVTTAGADLGELFQYTIATPVTVGRGQSAMAPIVSSWLTAHKDLLYNAGKMPTHPVATLRMRNETGLTLERGPLTVLENGAYAGEALLPFTAAGGEVVVPYAVELGAKVREESGATREMASLRVSGYYLIFEEWEIRWRDYRVNNSTARPLAVLIEHPRTAHYELFATPEPAEKTAEHLRFAMEVPAHGEATLRVQERRLISRREEMRRQSATALQDYLKHGLLERRAHDQILPLLALWERIAAHEQRLAEIEKERAAVYKAQEQIQGNMKALATAGKEGELRASYVDKLRNSEHLLQTLAGEEQQLRAEIQRIKDDIEAQIQALG
jgi:hypothetical protein